MCLNALNFRAYLIGYNFLPGSRVKKVSVVIKKKLSCNASCVYECARHMLRLPRYPPNNLLSKGRMPSVCRFPGYAKRLRKNVLL